jgi:hypothetical protein
LLIEQQHLLPLAAEGMDLARTSFPPSEWAASNS